MTTAQPSLGVFGAGLLEREKELGEVARLFDDVRSGRGRLLLIEAPAGLGKSTLLDEIRTFAGGFLVLEAAGREVERDLGWGVAGSLFEQWLARWGEDERADLLAGPAASASLVLGPDGEPSLLPAAEVGFGILHGLYWLAARAAERQPTLLIVDDAHWADEPSLRLLLYLLGRIRDRPIGLVVAARSGERGAGGLLAPLAAERGVSVCELAPLSAVAVIALIKSRLPGADDGFCRRCWELTAGNPLGVRELLLAIPDHASSAGPDLDAIAEQAARSLARSVLRRLGSLPADARALAEAVSVFEGGVELRCAAALAGLDDSAALAGCR